MILGLQIIFQQYCFKIYEIRSGIFHLNQDSFTLLKFFQYMLKDLLTKSDVTFTRMFVYWLITKNHLPNFCYVLFRSYDLKVFCDRVATKVTIRIFQNLVYDKKLLLVTMWGTYLWFDFPRIFYFPIVEIKENFVRKEDKNYMTLIRYVPRIIYCTLYLILLNFRGY